MAVSTLIIVGPGGVGKSPLDSLVQSDVVRLDPYRLRDDGPRDKDDRLFAPPKLRDELSGVLHACGDTTVIRKAAGETVEWYPKGGVSFFTVRGEWQCLIIPRNSQALAKMEIYAPVLPTLLTIGEFAHMLGTAKIVVLNPASESLLTSKDWKSIEKKTRHNCIERSDSKKSVQKRVRSVADEAPYWKELVEKHGAIEVVDWQFPEYICKHDSSALDRAKQCLLGLDGTLGQFFS